MDSSIRFERYEFKYWIPEPLTREIARFIAPYVEMDEYSRLDRERQYTITSLYLDSPRWGLYEDHLGHRPDRYKLRVRTYGKESEGPVTLEVKRKVRNAQLKSRCFLSPREAYPRCLTGADGGRLRFASLEERDYFDDFRHRMGVRRAIPRMLVRYTREAYESVVDGYVRVTFDRKAMYQPQAGWDLRGDPRGWLSVDGLRENGAGAFACLELKFESVFPRWLSELVRRFDLQRLTYSKYVSAVRTEREERYRAPELDLRPAFGA